MFIIPEADTRRFEFEFEGTVYAVPLLSNLPLDKSREFTKLANGREATDADAMEWVIAEIFEPACAPALKRMTNAQWQALFKAYLDESRVEPGESRA